MTEVSLAVMAWNTVHLRSCIL